MAEPHCSPAWGSTYVPPQACPPLIIPVEQPHSTTFTVPKSTATSFRFKGYVNLQSLNPGDTGAQTNDFTIEREDLGDSYRYRVKSASSFEVLRGNETISVTGSEVNDPLSPALPPARSRYDQKAWDAFAARVKPLREAAVADGNQALAERIDRELAGLKTILEAGVTSENLPQFLAARAAINESLQIAGLNIRETTVNAPGWNLRNKAYKFRMPADAGGVAPPIEIELNGSTKQTLTTFSAPPQPDSSGRTWAIAEGNGVMVSRAKLEDGSYELTVYVSEKYQGDIRLSPSGSGDNVTITAGRSEMSLAASWAETTVHPFGTPYHSTPGREVVSLPESIVHLLPPLETDADRQLAKEVDAFAKRVETTDPKLAKEIRSALASYRYYTLETTNVDPAKISASRAVLESCLAKGAVPGTQELVFTGTYRQVCCGCRVVLEPIYGYRTTPGIPAPAIPPTGSCRLLSPLPADCAGLTGEFSGLKEILDRTPPIATESSTHRGTFRREGDPTEYTFQITSLHGKKEGGYVLEFEVKRPEAPGGRAMVRYEIASNGSFAAPPTIRPAGTEYPHGAVAFSPPARYHSEFKEMAHKMFVGELLQDIARSQPRPKAREL